MPNEPAGNYVQKGYCRYAVFRIISFVVAAICLAFTITYVAAPLARAKINSKYISSKIVTKNGIGDYLLLSTYYLFKYQDYLWKKQKADDKESYSEWDGVEGRETYIRAMQAFGVLSLIFAIFAFIFVIVFFALLVTYNNARKAANVKRDGVYEKAHKREVSHSVMRHRIEDSDNRSFSHLPRQVDDDTIYMEADEEEVRELNRELAQLRQDEKQRRKVDRAIGWVLLFCWILLFVFSLIAVSLFANFKLNHIKSYMNSSAYKEYSLDDAGFSKTTELTSNGTISFPYMAGFDLHIVVIILSFIMIIFLAIQTLEGFICCPTYGDDGIKDLEMVRVDPPPSASAQQNNTYLSDRTGRTPSSLPPPLFNARQNGCSANDDGYGANTYTNNYTNNHNVDSTGAAYGIPVALPGPPVTPGATPQQVAESYYRDLGLPPPAYSQNSNNANKGKTEKKAA